MRQWWGVAVALLAIVAGVALAGWTQTRGQVTVSDLRFRAADGTTLSALLYRPASATAATPAPGVLAVHGYINTRETQSPFAIELARRGIVVLALDQRGHGFSGGAATRDGFGGPEGLAYLRALPFVDRARVGLEGHSMGGWTVLAAAARYPGAYRAMVLEGSSTGAPYAREGTPQWPRNLLLVYSRFDEFAPLMWEVPTAQAVGTSAKLRALFGTGAAPVAAGHSYGRVADGTARRLETPLATHPGDHLSTVAVGEAIDWLQQTLGAPRPLPAADQIWWNKEAGTGVALLGLGGLAFALLAALGDMPAAAPIAPRARRWRTRFWMTTLVPPVTFYLALLVLPPPLPVSHLFPQAIGNWLVVWALVNAAIGWGVGRWLGDTRPAVRGSRARGLALGAAVMVASYLLVAAAGLVPVDFRFWVVALKPLAWRQVPAFFAYLPAFALFVAVSFGSIAALAEGRRRPVAVGAAAASLGFLLLTGAQYLWLFATGALPFAFEALNAIVAIQFVPLLGALGALAVVARRRTGNAAAGVAIGAVFVSWYLVAGTATHVAL